MKNLQIQRINQFTLDLTKDLIELFSEVFGMNQPKLSQDSVLAELLGDPHFIALGAIIDGKLAAGLTAYVLPALYSQQAEIFLYDLAVRPAFQRQGLASNLLAALRENGKKMGAATLFVLANEEDGHALEFYRSCGGMEEKTRLFSFDL